MAAALLGISMRWSHAELRRSWRDCRPNDVAITTEVEFVTAINTSGLFGSTL